MKYINLISILINTERLYHLRLYNATSKENIKRRKIRFIDYE